MAHNITSGGSTCYHVGAAALITLLHVSVSACTQLAHVRLKKTTITHNIYKTNGRYVVNGVVYGLRKHTRLADPARSDVAGQLSECGVSRQLGPNRDSSPPQPHHMHTHTDRIGDDYDYDDGGDGDADDAVTFCRTSVPSFCSERRGGCIQEERRGAIERRRIPSQG